MYRKVTHGKRYLFDVDYEEGLIRCQPGHGYSVEDILDLVTDAENGGTSKRDGSILSDDYRRQEAERQQAQEEERAPLIPPEAYSG